MFLTSKTPKQKTEKLFLTTIQKNHDFIVKIRSMKSCFLSKFTKVSKMVLLKTC